MREYQTVMQDHLTARLIAAILHKLGETSITISTEDLKSLPPGHVESYGDPFNGTMTYRFRKYDHVDPDQQELPLASEATSDFRIGDRLIHRFPGRKKTDEAVVRMVANGAVRVETVNPDDVILSDWINTPTTKAAVFEAALTCVADSEIEKGHRRATEILRDYDERGLAKEREARDSTAEVLQAYEKERYRRCLPVFPHSPDYSAPLAEHVAGEPRPHPTNATTSSTNATTSSTNATAAEPADRDPSKLPAGDLTDEELAAEEKSVGKAWDDLSESMQEDGGRGGSPFEHLSERLNEIETEKQRRAATRA